MGKKRENIRRGGKVAGGVASGKVDNMEGIRRETELYTEKCVDVEKNRDGEEKEQYQRA